MDTTYPFRLDAEWYNWGGSFVEQIMLSPTAFSLTSSQASEVQLAFNLFSIAYKAAIDPKTRSKPNVQAKNDKLKAFRIAARQAVGIIQASQTVTNQQRVQLGLRVRKVDPTPTPVPGFAPSVSAIVTGPQSARFSARDAGAQDRRAKPFGVKFVRVVAYFGTSPVGDPRSWALLSEGGKADVDFYWSNIAQQTTVWFAASWVNTRGEAGPFSTPVSVRLAGSGVQTPVLEQVDADDDVDQVKLAA
jgi:hypothetical protein